MHLHICTATLVDDGGNLLGLAAIVEDLDKLHGDLVVVHASSTAVVAAIFAPAGGLHEHVLVFFLAIRSGMNL